MAKYRPTMSGAMQTAIDTPGDRAAGHCYHCGDAIPAGTDLQVEIAGVEQSMCCPGCAAVAGLIAASGLENFYQQRTAYNERPAQADAELAATYHIYDDPELAATFTTTAEDGTVSASLLLGGINCAACTWLIEHAMAAVDGIKLALVNLQHSRLDVQFDPQRCKLSEIFAHIDELGYQPQPYKPNTARQQIQEEYRADLRRLAVAGLGMMQVGMFAIALHAGDMQGIEAKYQMLLRWVSLPVAGFVVYYSARPFFVSAWRHLRRGILVMDLPVALAIGLAFLASVWATVSQSGQVYFDSVVMFTFLLLLGRFLERRARQQQLFTWFDAQSSLPNAVSVRRAGEWLTLPRIQLQSGDTILINAGDTVPADATVVSGRSAVREDTFNGEQLPRTITSGDAIYAGTVNIEEALEANVLGDFRDSRLAALQRSVDLAQTAKPELEQLADRVASWFVAGVLLTTSITALVWSQLDPTQAFWITLSVLVISCPCALALATPTALISAANALRSRGVIVRGQNAIDSLARCTHFVFDKTGTLTEGTLSIGSVNLLETAKREEVLAIAAALQHYSNHPVAHAFHGIPAASNFEQVTYRVGAGLQGQRAGAQFRLGSEQFCREVVADFPDPPDDEHYWIGLCRNATALAWIGLTDTIRAEAADIVRSIVDSGLKTELLTGDSSAQGPRLARVLGIERVLSGQAPEQKLAHIQELQDAGAVVCMVGDGLNDAPVLSAANASFAVAGATDLARAQADFVVADGDLHQVITTWHIAKRCHRIIRQNFIWALGYNLSAIPLATLGYIPPWAAAIGMSLSSLLVVGNSLRLNK